MKAIVQERYGSPDDLQLREVDQPVPGDEDVLVRVRAASVHPDVWHVVVGRPYVLRLMGGGFSRPKRSIPGTDMAGIVASVGKGVTQFRRGDEVFGETITRWWTNGGAFAEYVCVRQDSLALKSDNVTFEQAAAVPSSGFITLQNLRDPNQVGPGRTVLINGAAGGVGAIALQFAKAHGAHVTAVDSTSKRDMLGELGADAVIDYTREDFTRRGVRYDLIVDIPANRPFAEIRRALEADGRYGRYVPIGHEQFGAAGRRVFGLVPHFVQLMLLSRFVKTLRGPRRPAPTRQQAMAILRELLEAGKLTPIIDSRYPLREAPAAIRHMIEDELHGKIIINP